MPKGIGSGIVRIFILVSAALFGCGGSDSPVVASFKDQKLTRKQLDAMIPKGVADSARYAENIINQWIHDVSICDAATTADPTLAEQVEWQIQDTRRKLIIHLYTTKLINDSLKPSVSMERIQNYYTEHADKYISKQNLYSYIFISTEQKETGEISDLMKKGDPSDWSTLRNWAKENAVDFKLDSTYLEESFISELKKGYFGTLKKSAEGKFIRWETVILGKTRKYLFRMTDKVEAGDPMPLSLVKEDIHNMLLNEEKVRLVDAAEERILKNAKPYVKR